MTKQHIGLISLVVEDYDAAIEFYTNKLGFELICDLQQPGKRWVVVAPPGGAGCTQLLLARAKNAEERTRIGNQTGGRVGFFLQTDDFWRDHQRYQAQGVQFCETPREEPYGTVVVFKDLYGNKWDLLQSV